MSTATRIPLVLPVAATITIGLFMMMRGLIDVGEISIPEVEDMPEIVINFEPDPVVIDDGIDMSVLEPVEPPPVQPDYRDNETDVGEIGGESFVYTAPPVETGGLDFSTTRFQVDTDPQPVVRIEPSYPSRAINRGISGACTIVFDITSLGTTSNVRASSCTDQAFAQASINAVRGWRYNPQVSNGEAILYQGASTTLVYQLDS